MANGGYTRKRPCRVCRKHFRPNSRVGDRQKTCGDPACQKSWKQRKNQEAYRKEPDYFRGRALRQKLVKLQEEPTRIKRSSSRRPLPLPRDDISQVMGDDGAVVGVLAVEIEIGHIRESLNKGLEAELQEAARICLALLGDRGQRREILKRYDELVAQ